MKVRFRLLCDARRSLLLPLSHQYQSPPNSQIPAATSLMARSKAKNNKKQKQKKDSGGGSLESDEYFVGTLLNTTSARTRPNPQRVSREGPSSKGQCHSKNRCTLGERAFALASAFSAA